MAAQRLLDALHAVHRALHHRIEVLHAEAGAVEAAAPRKLAMSPVLKEARIELDGEIAVGARGQMEVAAQALHQLADLCRVEEVRRAAAEVQLHDFAVAVEQRRHQLDLACQALQIGRGARRVARDDAVAAAVEARD